MLSVTQTVSHQILIGVVLRYCFGICLDGLWMTTDHNSDCITSNDELNWKGRGKHET